MDKNCGSYMAVTNVSMAFDNLSKADFQAKYAKGVAAALADVTQQPMTSVVALDSAPAGNATAAGNATVAPAAATGRKMLEAAAAKKVGCVYVYVCLHVCACACARAHGCTRGTSKCSCGACKGKGANHKRG